MGENFEPTAPVRVPKRKHLQCGLAFLIVCPSIAGALSTRDLSDFRSSDELTTGFVTKNCRSIDLPDGNIGGRIGTNLDVLLSSLQYSRAQTDRATRCSG